MNAASPLIASNPEKANFSKSDVFNLLIPKLREPLDIKYYKCVKYFKCAESDTRKYYKALICNQENCEHCGSDYSQAHQRRIAKAFPKVLTYTKAGYMVITIPALLRPYFLNKQALNDMRTYIKRKLKREHPHKDKTGFKNGLMRWHWSGDDGLTWKPHLNIIFESGYINKEWLNDFKNDVIHWINETTKNFRQKHNIKRQPGNIYYAYRTLAAMKKHLVNYVTRATYKGNNDKIIDVIKGYRNNVTFGKFEFTSDATNIESALINVKTKEVVNFETGEIQTVRYCEDPQTGEKIIWQPGFIYASKFYKEIKPLTTALNIGYYILEKLAHNIPIKEAEQLPDFAPIYNQNSLKPVIDF